MLKYGCGFMDLKFLYEYMYRRELKLLYDITLLENNLHYLQADYVDHLEMILAKCKLETAQQIFNDIYLILKNFS